LNLPTGDSGIETVAARNAKNKERVCMAKLENDKDSGMEGLQAEKRGSLKEFHFFSRASLCELIDVLVGISSAALKIWFHPLTIIQFMMVDIYK